jgi:hypothetical protein
MIRHVLSVCAITAWAFAALTGTSTAQQKSTKDMLAGAWTLLLSDAVKADGTHVPQFGPNPSGLLMFSPDGHYSVEIMRANLPKLAANDRDKPTPDEMKAIMLGALSHFGTYVLNDAEKSLTFRIEASSYPNWNGTQQKRTITGLTDDVLTYNVKVPSGNPTGVDHVELVWRKAK